MVTGVSTGALIAPFAFLGLEYDDFLRMFYTTTNTELITEDRWLLSAFFSDALAGTKPLRELLDPRHDSPLEIRRQRYQCAICGHRRFNNECPLFALRTDLARVSTRTVAHLAFLGLNATRQAQGAGQNCPLTARRGQSRQVTTCA